MLRETFNVFSCLGLNVLMFFSSLFSSIQTIYQALQSAAQGFESVTADMDPIVVCSKREVFREVFSLHSVLAVVVVVVAAAI